MVSGQNSVIRSFFNALLNSRNVFSGDNAAFDFVFPFKTLASCQGPHSQPAMAVLAPAARLPDILAFSFSLAPNSFFVSHLGLAHVGFYVKLSFHSVNDNLQVKLAHAGNNGLQSFFIGFNPESWVFFH